MTERTLSIEAVPGHPDFTRLAAVPGVGVDLRYASPNNFVGSDLYSPYDCAWLHREGAERLAEAALHLRAARGDVRLMVLDALRPQRVQERLWKQLEGSGLEIYLANPVRGSIHSFGMAVDVTVVDAAGRELDMGTPFDDLTERSWPAREPQMLDNGEITREQLANRLLLREAMERAGWQGITREWWHFDGGDRDRIRAEFARIL